MDTPKMEKAYNIQRLLERLDYSTCNFRAVEQIETDLKNNGFLRLEEKAYWNLEPNGKYYVVKNGSAVFAFVLGGAKQHTDTGEIGARIISAHTDSPCFKIKPNCEIYGEGGVVSLNVEKYGGGILYTWFDRPLSLSGRVVVGNPQNPTRPKEYIIDFATPIATIPHLAIHFNRAVNEGNPLSVQKDMKPVIGYFSEEEIKKFKAGGGAIRTLISDFLKKHAGDELTLTPNDILDYELSLYPFETASLVGIEGQYFQSGRIDDLSMAFAGIDALLDTCDTECEDIRIVALFDNEETGSGTKQGAHSPVLRRILERICQATMSDNPQAIHMLLANSFMISADDAHGWHPNYGEKQDPTNHPVLGGGPVVKINANCKYMTDAYGAAVFRQLCENAGVKSQYFVNHSDVAGGSTLGNISSVQLDIPGVDVGNAIWAMHSARETGAVADQEAMVKVLREFLK